VKYRADVDGLRAIAVLPVVLYHSGLGFSGGFVGVDVFYVISGFLITKIIYDLSAERRFSFADFYDRRIRRLFPALFVLLLAVTLWSAIYLLSPDLEDFGGSLFSAAVYASNIYFYKKTGYFDEAAATKPLLHTWSLAIEEQFYILVPFLLIALVRFVDARWHVPFLLVLSATSFVLCLWLTAHDTAGAFYLLPPRAWELGIGGALAIAAPPVHRYRWLAEGLTVAGIAAIAFAVFVFSDATPFPGWRVAIPTLGAAAILSTNGRSGAMVERLLSTAPFTFIGKISYSLYLWHWPVIVSYDYGRAPVFTETLECVAVFTLLAILSWRFVEAPVRTRRLLGSRRALFLAAAMASVATAAIGLVLMKSEGLPQRQSERVTALLDERRWISPHRSCHYVSIERAAADRLCVRGAQGVTPTFLLAGDSHADAISEGLFAAARDRSVAGIQYTAPSFVPLPGRYSLTYRRPDNEAETFIQYLSRHPELRTIILSGFWSRHVTGQSYRAATRILIDEEYEGSGAAYNPVSFRRALTKLVTSFPDRRFVLLDDIPSGYGLSLREHARTMHVSGREPVGGIPREEADRQRATYEPIFERIAADFPNVVYLPVLSHLCGPEACPLFREDGVPIFRDGDHLSRQGSMDLKGHMMNVFGSTEYQD
jgi:peptidoglycan/LPS O-acetylase OafA/YrhL